MIHERRHTTQRMMEAIRVEWTATPAGAFGGRRRQRRQEEDAFHRRNRVFSEPKMGQSGRILIFVRIRPTFPNACGSAHVDLSCLLFSFFILFTVSTPCLWKFSKASSFVFVFPSSISTLSLLACFVCLPWCMRHCLHRVSMFLHRLMKHVTALGEQMQHVKTTTKGDKTQKCAHSIIDHTSTTKGKTSKQKHEMYGSAWFDNLLCPKLS